MARSLLIGVFAPLCVLSLLPACAEQDLLDPASDTASLEDVTLDAAFVALDGVALYDEEGALVSVADRDESEDGLVHLLDLAPGVYYLDAWNADGQAVVLLVSATAGFL